MNPNEVERFQEAFHAHYGAILGFFLRRLQNWHDAEELAEATFLAGWRRLHEVPDEPGTRAWLFGVGRGLLANYWRSERRRRRLHERLASEEIPTKLVTRDGAEDEPLVMVAFRQLRPEDQELLRLTVWDGLTPGECAVVLDCPSNTIYVRLHRARSALRERLTELTGPVSVRLPDAEEPASAKEGGAR